MRTWKLVLEYDGTKYSGWQEQINARTVAGEVKSAAVKVLGNSVFELQGAGRTDAGVHASAQVAHLREESKRRLNRDALVRELNLKLPSDVAVLEAVEMPNKFHARHDAVSRSYVYQISTRKSAFDKKFVWWIKEPLDVGAMAQAAKSLEGRHDFACFRQVDPSKPGESSVVVVDSAGIEVEGSLVLFRIEASHFLWRMVRRLAGTLVKLGLGEIRAEDFRALLEGKCRAELDIAGWTAPASGLFLESVRY